MSNHYHHREDLTYDMIVFCHLRWDFVYQRPQHLLSRLAEHYKILVVEEPVGIYSSDRSFFKIRQIASNIDSCRPLIQDLSQVGEYLKLHLKQETFSIGWFYSAAFFSVLNTLAFDTVIYDCMDELTLFKGASPQLIRQETELLAAADIVFTGGKSLYEAKAAKHQNVHCFPSSVDIAHFSNAGADKISRPADLEPIKNYIVGYYGVIDERIDLDLIEVAAAVMPEVSFVMIGPICKIEEAELPMADNIHYLGMKSYEELPRYLHFFDIAMMPFALNDSTRFISPTKTLEYMAAKKPIISTKITDVVRDYSTCINLIEDVADFKNALENPIDGYRTQYADILERTSWDRTVANMSSIINQVLA